ncbi:MAG: hypothetical protein WB443_03760, partial [Nitrososphaeraceae archaeon]
MGINNLLTNLIVTSKRQGIRPLYFHWTVKESLTLLTRKIRPLYFHWNKNIFTRMIHARLTK